MKRDNRMSLMGFLAASLGFPVVTPSFPHVLAFSPTGCAAIGSGGSPSCPGAATFSSPLTVTNPPPPGPFPAGSVITLGATVSN